MVVREGSFSPKDLSRSSFVTVVIVHSHRAFELVNKKFHSHSPKNVHN